jgi:hypothetical protein
MKVKGMAMLGCNNRHAQGRLVSGIMEMSLDGFQIWHTLRILGGRFDDLACILLVFCLFFFTTLSSRA